MADEKIVAVNQGATYELKEAGRDGEKTRVVAFYVDRPRSNVRFAPLHSGREDQMSIDEFLDTYTLVAEEGEPLPEAKKENARAQRAAEKRTEADRSVRTPLMDTRTASPTREALEARAEKRNK